MKEVAKHQRLNNGVSGTPAVAAAGTAGTGARPPKFEKMQGGNPANPVLCTNNRAGHKKGSLCAFNHSEKDD